MAPPLKKKALLCLGLASYFPVGHPNFHFMGFSAEVLARAPQTHMFFLVVGHFFSLNFLAANSRGWRYLICTSRSPYTPHPRSFFVPASDRKMKRPRHTRLALRLCFPDFLSSVCVCVCVCVCVLQASIGTRGATATFRAGSTASRVPGTAPAPLADRCVWGLPSPCWMHILVCESRCHHVTRE